MLKDFIFNPDFVEELQIPSMEGEIWKHLTNELDFSSLKQRLPKCFTFDQIKQCCEFFQNNKIGERSIRRYCMDCLLYIKYDRPITESVTNSIRLIYQKKRYTCISKNYNF